MTLIRSSKKPRVGLKDLRLLKKYEEILDSIAKDMSLPKEVTDHAKTLLYHISLFNFDLIYDEIRRSKKYVIGAIIEIASRELGFYFSTKYFVRKYGITYRTFYKFLNRLSHELGIYYDFDINRAIEFYSRYLNLSSEDINKIKDIMDKLTDEMYSYRKFLIALVTYLHCVKKMTMNEIAKKLCITTKSVERYLKKGKEVINAT